jgi:hypothetical protein
VLAASIIRAMNTAHRPDDFRFSRLIALMMEAASTSETSVNFYQTTRRNNPGDDHLHSRRRENLKSHIFLFHLHVLIFHEVITRKAASVPISWD